MAERHRFTGSQGQELSGRFERPSGHINAVALFAHCFTCSKDVAAATRISRALTRFGIGVLRFDFTGLGNSDGDFENTDFSSNVADVVAAARFLATEYRAPEILIGHSLGGAAVLRAAGQLEGVRAVVTVGAPSSPDHVKHLFAESIEEIQRQGRGCVSIGNRKFTVTRDFLDDLEDQSRTQALGQIDAAKLILHSPSDDIVHVENAREIYDALRHPKSFISLDGADHLLSRRQDSEYVANVVAAWVSRYIQVESPTVEETKSEGEVVTLGHAGSFRTRVLAGNHAWTADEPEGVGGTDLGPSPYDMLLAALGACTSMTLFMYAKRKGIPVEEVEVRLEHERTHRNDGDSSGEKSDGLRLERISRAIRVKGELSSEQLSKLGAIADKCPVHRSLRSQPDVVSKVTKS